MYPDLVEKSSSSSSETMVTGVSPVMKFDIEQMFGEAASANEGGCKCGSNCTCDPCNCK